MVQFITFHHQYEAFTTCDVTHDTVSVKLLLAQTEFHTTLLMASELTGWQRLGTEYPGDQ